MRLIASVIITSTGNNGLFSNGAIANLAALAD